MQEVPLETFASLGENDLLFIDSSHVSKIGSDVNRLYFDVLPVLAPGVLIHIHDVAGNLEYPRDWFEEGRAWNEQYLLRAFLMNNRDYRIELFTAWLLRTCESRVASAERMPMCARRRRQARSSVIVEKLSFESGVRSSQILDARCPMPDFKISLG